MTDPSLLVPLDGSTTAECALPFAAALGRALHKPLTLLSVVEPLPHGLRRPAAAQWEALARALWRDRRQYLEKLSAALAERGLRAESQIVAGEAVPEILAAVTRGDSAMIVMATHGRGGVQRLVIGSVADKVMRLSRCPTLLVPAVAEGTPIPEAAIVRILAPVDGSPQSEAALGPAVELAEATGAAVTLVRVEPWLASRIISAVEYMPDFTDADAAVAEAAEEYLTSVAARLPNTVRTECTVLRGVPAPALAAFAQEHAPSLLVMATHGRGGMTRLAFGSVADRLVREGLPILLIPPRASAAADPVQPGATAGRG